MQTELSVALEIVSRACELTRTIQHETVSQVFKKEDKSPVTLADYSSQLLVTHYLQEAFPDLVLMAEENISELSQRDPAILAQVSGYLERFLPGNSLTEMFASQEKIQWNSSHHRYWVLDPIDGTKGFLRGDQYIIALALMENGRPILGVIGCPNLGPHGLPTKDGPGILAYAVRGQGAWILQIGGNNQPVKLEVSHCSDPSTARFVSSVESGHSDNSEIQSLKDHLANSVTDHHFDSQAKYVMVAAGQFDVFFRLPPKDRPVYHEKVWDHAAGALLVEESGGQVTDIYGKPFDFTKGTAMENNYGIVVTNRLVHSPIVEFFIR